jgi:hypothetical protein
MKFSVADYNNNVHSTVFPSAPRVKRSAATRVPRRRRQSSSLNPRPAWDLPGYHRRRKTSLRGGGGMFFDQHRDGESATTRRILRHGRSA